MSYELAASTCMPIVAVMFISSALLKGMAIDNFSRQLVAIGAGESRWIPRAIVLVEILIGVAIVVAPGAASFGGAFVALAVLTGGGSVAIAKTGTCGCRGNRSPRNATRRHEAVSLIRRNVLMMAACILAVDAVDSVIAAPAWYARSSAYSVVLLAVMIGFAVVSGGRTAAPPFSRNGGP